MAEVKIIPGKLSGQVIVPPSKSIAHRAVICAALAKGTSAIENVSLSVDIVTTCQGMEKMGAVIDIENSSIKDGRKRLVIHGNGKINTRNKTIECNESGSTLRFLIPIAATRAENVTFTGKGRLAERPLSVYYEIFDQQNLAYITQNGQLPLTLKSSLIPGTFSVRGDISSQFITGLMLALPLLDWHSEIQLTTHLESASYVDITGDVLQKFGIEYACTNGYNSIQIKGNQKYKSCDYTVEGDWSQAGFWIAAAANGGTLTLSGLNKDSKQGDRVILELFKRMGGHTEEAGDIIRIHKGQLEGTDIDVSDCPDLVPYIAAMACCARGTTRILNAARLRLKESDRLKALTTELLKLGADIAETDDGLVIHGVEQLKGGSVSGWQDHRIVMALAAVSPKCTGEVMISGSEAISKSYPDFWEDFKNMGGNLV